MNPERAAQNLEVIRQLMERPVKISTQSGLGAILAGCATIAGAIFDSHISASLNRSDEDRQIAFWINIGVWAVVFVVSMAASLGLMRLREFRRHLPFWTPAKRRILSTIIWPFIAGVGLNAAIMYRWYHGIGPNQWGLIPPIWMITYGLACWGVGQYSINEIKVMGAAFILSGLATAAFFQSDFPGIDRGMAPYLTLGITFGGFHIVYGTIVWARHGG